MTGLKHAQAVGAPCSLINRAGSMSLSSGASSKDVRYISHAIHRRPSRQGLRLHKIQLFPLRYHHSPQRRRIADPFKHFCLYGDEQINNVVQKLAPGRTSCLCHSNIDELHAQLLHQAHVLCLESASADLSVQGELYIVLGIHELQKFD